MVAWIKCHKGWQSGETGRLRSTPCRFQRAPSLFPGNCQTPLLYFFVVAVLSFSPGWLSVTSGTVACQALWDSPGNNPGVGCHFLLQRTLLTQESNPRLLRRQEDSSPRRHQGRPLCFLPPYHPLPSPLSSQLSNRFILHIKTSVLTSLLREKIIRWSD